MTVNDNVHKNLEGFSVKLFDQDQRFNKEEFSSKEKELLVDKFIENDLMKQEEMIFDATDRILLAHRNLKLLLFLTSGPFFAVLFLFKYISSNQLWLSNKLTDNEEYRQNTYIFSLFCPNLFIFQII